MKTTNAEGIYKQAWASGATSADEAESLTRCVLVLQRVCEPVASQEAHEARMAVESKSMKGQP